MTERYDARRHDELEHQQLGLDMPLTAEEIANKRFLTAFRGYAKWEVDQFLLDVAVDYRRAIGLAQWALERQRTGAPPTVERPVATAAKRSSVESPAPPRSLHAPAGGWPLPPPDPRHRFTPPAPKPPVDQAIVSAPSVSSRAVATAADPGIGGAEALFDALNQQLALLRERLAAIEGNQRSSVTVWPERSQSNGHLDDEPAWWPRESPIEHVVRRRNGR